MAAIIGRVKQRYLPIFCGVLAATCMLFCCAAPASAHVLKTDGTISGILHVNPDDLPVSGPPTTFILFMDDATGRFSLANCRCTVTIEQNGRTIAAEPLRPNAQSFPGGSVTFPSPGAYQFTVRGEPIHSGAFQPFTLVYLERVAQGPTSNVLSSASIMWLAVCAAVAGVSVMACWFQFKYNSQHREEL